MRDLAIRALLCAAIVFLLSACASNSGVVTESPGAQTATPVPGEKLPDQDMVIPGTNPNASMRW